MGLAVFFAPEDAVELDPAVLQSREEGYEYVLDVTDQVNYIEMGPDDRVEKALPNVFSFQNFYPSRYGNYPLVVKNIELVYISEAEIEKLGELDLEKFVPAAPAATLSGEGFQLNISPGGGMTLNVDGKEAFLQSRYSYPAEPVMGFYTLTVAEPEADSGITVNVSGQTDQTEAQVKMVAPQYTLTRNLAVNGHRIEVRDTLENTSEEDLGLAWSQDLGFTKRPDEGFRLAGQPDVTLVPALGSRNPTLFAQSDGCSVGLVAEDTVSRCQLELAAARNILSMKSNGMGIPAGKSVTLDWAIYPSNGGGYYDFINCLREDWQVNTTIPGPYAIRAAVIPGLNCKIGSVIPWYDYAEGAGLTREEYLAEVQPKIAELRKALPGVKLMGLVETNLVNFDASSVPWGYELPLTYADRKNPKTKYAQFLSPELTAKLDESTPYRDSLMRDKDGNAMIDTWYVYKPIPFINLMVQPERGNHRYEVMMENVDFLMDTAGFDGVYFDQFQPWLHDGFSENRWDGVTVELDPTGKIARKRYSYAITGATGRADILRKVTDRGGVVVINGHPSSREEQNTGVISFQEMENDVLDLPGYVGHKPPELSWQVSGHLATPIILGIRTEGYADINGVDRRAEMMTKAIITALRNGLLYYYYGTDQPLEGELGGSYEIGNHMFPFTPVKLGEGVLVGKERTVGAISGSYLVDGSEEPKVYLFDRQGRPKAVTSENVAISGNSENWTVDIKLDDWSEVFVIEIVE